MRSASDKGFVKNQSNQPLHCVEDVQTIHQANANDVCHRSGGLSSKDVGSEQSKEACVRQWPYNGPYDIEDLLKGYPKIEEISDEEYARIIEGSRSVSHLDNPGDDGRIGIVYNQPGI